MLTHRRMRCYLSLAFVFVVALLGGCKGGPVVPVQQVENATYGYVPLDPLPVIVTEDKPTSTSQEKADFRRSLLPDETVRIAIGQRDTTLGITYGVASGGFTAGTYRIVLDYMMFTTAQFELIEKPTPVGVTTTTKSYEALAPAAGDKAPVREPDAIIPVYVGVGLRIVAEVTVTDGKVNLGSLFAIGAAAEQKKLTGTLMVQSMGIGGSAVSSVIPMPSEINQTTIANAVTALATIKSKIYDKDTSINPRVLGLYNTLGGTQQTVNGIIGLLLRRPPHLPLANGLPLEPHATWANDHPDETRPERKIQNNEKEAGGL